jgi:hypothetical protein
MSKFNLRELKKVDLLLLLSGFFFALLLIAVFVYQMFDPAFTTGNNFTMPLGGLTFTLIGIYVLRNLKLPHKNLGYLLVAAGVFSFFVSAVLLYRVVSK